MEKIEKRNIKFTTHFRKTERKLLEKLAKAFKISQTEVIVKALYELYKEMERAEQENSLFSLKNITGNAYEATKKP